MGMFRPGLDLDDGKAPLKGPTSKKGRKAIAPSATPTTGDIKELEKAHRRAEKRLIRARGRVEHIESDLLLADDPEDVDDLKAELSEATKKKESALRQWEATRQELNAARAREKAEASFKEEDLIEVPKPVEKRPPRKAKRSTKAARISFADVKPEDVEEAEELEACEPMDLDELEAFEAELVTEEELDGAIPRKKGFKWTPKKAIAVGIVLFLVLPLLLYGLVIPRADVTVKTWYYEGFQNSIVVDAKVQNHGTVDIKGLDLNISVLKVTDEVEVYITELTFSDPLVYAREEQKVESITFHDDQNDDYIILVQVTYEAGGKLVDESYTHHIDKPYMNVVFEDNMFMWAF